MNASEPGYVPGFDTLNPGYNDQHLAAVDRCRIAVAVHRITKLDVDAIVNAANNSLPAAAASDGADSSCRRYRLLGVPNAWRLRHGEAKDHARVRLPRE